MSTPEPSRDPAAAPQFLVYSKLDAATKQLETAITLWFDYGDPMSIHTLWEKIGVRSQLRTT
jgi:hypothetical protein